MALTRTRRRTGEIKKQSATADTLVTISWVFVVIAIAAFVLGQLLNIEKEEAIQRRILNAIAEGEALEACKQAEELGPCFNRFMAAHAKSMPPGLSPADLSVIYFGTLSFITSGFGLIALVWTFREQRKVTEGVARAYVEVLELRVDPGEESWRVKLIVANTGQTPATDLSAKIVFTLRTPPYEKKQITFQEHVVKPEADIAYLAAQGTDMFSGLLNDFEREASYPKEYPRPVVLYAEGSVTFSDAFGRTRDVAFSGRYWGSIFPSEGFHMDGVGRPWDFEKARRQSAGQHQLSSTRGARA